MLFLDWVKTREYTSSHILLSTYTQRQRDQLCFLVSTDKLLHLVVVEALDGQSDLVVVGRPYLQRLNLGNKVLTETKNTD